MKIDVTKMKTAFDSVFLFCVFEGIISCVLCKEINNPFLKIASVFICFICFKGLVNKVVKKCDEDSE